MGVLGYPNFFLQTFDFEKDELFVSSISSNYLYHGVD